MSEKKLLFWLDSNPNFFGISKFIQEKFNAEFYAIIDINNRTKKFYKNQEIVNFKKVWYYQDYIIDTKLNFDLSYLKEFEKKYEINLWKIIFGDRHFYKYNQFYIFSHKEVLTIVEKCCRFFESILNDIKPDFLIIKRPDFLPVILIQEICRSIGINILLLDFPRVGSRALITSHVDKIDNFDGILKKTSVSKFDTFEDAQKYLKGFGDIVNKIIDDQRTSKIDQIKASIEFFTKVCNNEYRKYFPNYGRTPIQVLKKQGSLPFRRKKNKSFIDKNSMKTINTNQKFIYFPLHLEPEETLLVTAPYYTDQLALIINIAKSIPIDFKLYVKEHPSMRIYGWRDIDYYKQIINLPNVKLIHPSVSPEIILQKCSLVVTISGTSGLEAAFYNKPSIIFEDLVYASLPSVELVKNIKELPSIIRLSLNKKVDISSLNDFVNFIEENSFPYEIEKFSMDQLHRFFRGGFLYDVEISNEKMNDYLEDNRSSFEKVTNQFIEKIKNSN